VSKQLLFSVTAADCRWDYYVASGDGGQNRQKRNTAVRCTHIASGAVGKSSDGRSQEQNRKVAFQHMAESEVFKKWHKIEIARRTGRLDAIDRKVEEALAPTNIKTEVRDEKGLWKKIDESEIKDETVCEEKGIIEA
jgi:protein subunit release factor B